MEEYFVRHQVCVNERIPLIMRKNAFEAQSNIKLTIGLSAVWNFSACPLHSTSSRTNRSAGRYRG